MNNSTRDLNEREAEVYIRDHWEAGRLMEKPQGKKVV